MLQMYSMPVFDMIEAAFRNWGLTRNKLVTRLFMRSLYVVFTCFVAVSLPFFGGKFYLAPYSILAVTFTGHHPPKLVLCLHADKNHLL